jgi:hypothetical protein
LGFQPPESLDLLFGGLIESDDHPNPDCLAALPNDICQMNRSAGVDLQPDPAPHIGSGNEANLRPILIQITDDPFRDFLLRPVCDTATQDAPIPTCGTTISIGTGGRC